MSDAEDVERAVRGYVDAYAHGRDVSEYAAGVAADVSRPGTLEDIRVDVRRLEVQRVDADGAEVDLDARLRAWYVQPGGAIESRTDLCGPVLLRRQGRAWKVVDYTVDGRLRSEAIVPVAGEVEADGLALAIREAHLRPRSTLLRLTVRNGTDGRFALVDVHRGVRLAGLWTYGAVPATASELLAAGETREYSVGWTERFDDVRELRLVLGFGELDGPRRVLLLARLLVGERARLEPLGRLPLGFRLPPRVRRLLVWLPVAIPTLLLLVHLRLAGGVGFVAAGAWSLVAAVQLARRRALGARNVLVLLLGCASLVGFGLLLVAQAPPFGR